MYPCDSINKLITYFLVDLFKIDQKENDKKGETEIVGVITVTPSFASFRFIPYPFDVS